LDPAPRLSSEHSTSSLDCFSEVQEFARAKLEDIRQKNQATNWRKQMRSAHSELPWRLVFIAVISASLLNGAERVAGQDSLPAAPSTCILGPNDQISFWGIDVDEIVNKQFRIAKNPEDNILMMPHDVITVPWGELVYVIGEVNKAGGFILTERSNMSVLQALSLAEGSQRTADTRHAKILRLEPGQEQRREIVVNLPRRLPGLGRRDRNGLPARAASTLLGAQDARHPRTRAPPRLPP
jgi:hypothetical protein